MLPKLLRSLGAVDAARVPAGSDGINDSAPGGEPGTDAPFGRRTSARQRAGLSMHRYALGQRPPAEQEWLTLNTNLAKTEGQTELGPKVLCREPAEGRFSVLFVTALLGTGAVLLLLVIGNRLRQGAYGIPPTGLLTYGAGIALGLSVLIWRTRATIAALTCPYVPMWIVSNEALLRVSPTTVKVWEPKGIEKLTLHMNIRRRVPVGVLQRRGAPGRLVRDASDRRSELGGRHRDRECDQDRAVEHGAADAVRARAGGCRPGLLRTAEHPGISRDYGTSRTKRQERVAGAGSLSAAQRGGPRTVLLFVAEPRLFAAL